MKKSVFLIGLIALMSFTQLSSQVKYESGKLTVENELYKKVISIPENNAGRVTISSIFSKKEQKDLIVKPSAPYFEFVINEKLITAQDLSWKYKEYKLREMQNGGTEIQIIISGEKGQVKGLELVIFQQIFPNSTLIREKIELHSSNGKVFSLNKLEGKLHFKFPQYSIINNKVEIEEIRIATWRNEQIEFEKNATYDDRDWDNEGGLNLTHCHMFHPDFITYKLEDGDKIITKGPINILTGDKVIWIATYEHASQDNRLDVAPNTFGWEEHDEDFHFLGINNQKTEKSIQLSVDILRGGYLDGEMIHSQKPYESVWTASAFYHKGNLEAGKSIIRNYLFHQICEKPESRKPMYYYNTWGMQRDMQRYGYNIRDVFTEKRILKEISNAADLGVDIFVLDDGWQQSYGDWKPHKDKLRNGLSKIKKELDKYDMKMGIWISTVGVSKDALRYKQHPEWVIKDAESNPVSHQGGHPAFDMVGPYYDAFVSDCKWLIDHGARFFKWDAINTLNSTLPNLYHGSEKYSAKERKERYEYLLPLYVTKAMEELTDYEPEVVIEIDLTEAKRCLVGLAPLSQGLLFWMNNGAAWYGDYSSYRAKSMRTIITQFSDIIPVELFTFANYPHNVRPYYTQRYQVNSSLAGGHGFWGDLDTMTIEQRKRVGELVGKSKRVLPYIADIKPKILGKIGSSPEIYTTVNKEKCVGQVLGFSGSIMEYTHKIPINSSNLLAVLNHAYSVKDNILSFDFTFTMPDDTREAFIIPNESKGISIISSTSWLSDVQLNDKKLVYISGDEGAQEIYWAKTLGEPIAEGNNIRIIYDEEETQGYYRILVVCEKAGTEVVIKP